LASSQWERIIVLNLVLFMALSMVGHADEVSDEDHSRLLDLRDALGGAYLDSWRATYELVDCGSLAIPYLEDWVANDPDVEVRFKALYALGAIGDVSSTSIVAAQQEIRLGSIVRPIHETAAVLEYPTNNASSSSVLEKHRAAYVAGSRETMEERWLFVMPMPLSLEAPNLRDFDPGWVRAADVESYLRSMADKVLLKFHLLRTGHRKAAILWTDYHVLRLEPSLESPVIQKLEAGTAIKVIQQRVQSPTDEVGGRGGIQVYDQIQIMETGTIGWVARAGDNLLPWF